MEDREFEPYGTPDELLEELKAAAFEVLLLNPGTWLDEWKDTLMEQYGTEVVDVYGSNPLEVQASLDELWESPYMDRNSGLEYKFRTWAAAFATEESVQMYYDLTQDEEK